LSGRVEDTNGAAISGATVEAIRRETNQTQSAIADSDGRYRFAYLPVGVYELDVSQPGFTHFKKDIAVTIGEALDVRIRLAVANVNATVNVASDFSAIELVRTQIASTIHSNEIDELPLNGRNYLDLALLVPGVSPANTGSNQRFAETSAVPGQGLSFSGQRNLNNSFVVDGLSANDDAADLTGTYFSQEVVREFQVITSGGIAEFGRAGSGVVNVVTQSGTNDWRGRVYGFLRNQRLDARNPLATQKDLLTQVQYGATGGGPLRHDRTYSNVSTIAPAAVGSINNRLSQVGFSGPRLETGVVPGSFDTTNIFARVDHKLNDANQLTARYSFYQILAENSRSIGGLNSLSRGSGLSDRDQTWGLSNITSVSRGSLNEARFQFTHSSLAAPLNDRRGPAVSIAGVANFGAATSSPLARDIDLVELVDNFSSQRRNHAVKVGGDFLYNRVNILFPGAVQGLYNFTSLANFLSGSYLNFQQAFGTPGQSQANPNVGFFVQDEWRLRPDLTFNLGLRYDAQFLPEPIRTDGNNFAPRLGFAYAPGDRRTVIRAGWGIYFDRLPLRATSNALQRDGSKYVVVQLSPGQAGAPVFPNILAVQPASLTTKPNITRIDANIEASDSQQFNLQLERELSRNTWFSFGYLRLRGRHIIVQRNINVPRFPSSANVPNLGRPDPDWGNISRYESSGDSSYHGMIGTLNQRAGQWASLRVSYTLSKAIDDTGNFFFSTPQNNFDLGDDRGLSDNDQRHRLVVSGMLQTPPVSRDSHLRWLRGFQFSYIFTYASRLPFNVLLGSDRNFDTNNNDRPVGVGRNTGRGFDFASLDLRVSRRIRLSERLNLDLLAEGFNVFNRANLSIPNNVFGSGVGPLPAFGQSTAAADPRQFQVGIRFSF
jgi:hypothetical protein